MMSQNAETKIIQQRLSVLDLAKALGNVSEACRQRDISRTQFYEYKRRFQTHGLAGLRDLPPIHHSHPFTTAPEVEERILAISLEHPAWGCNRLSDWLKLEGPYVSAITIQKILNRNNMSSRYDRWLKLEQKHSQLAFELNAEQVKFLEKQNPSFRERHVESSRPGELLCQDTFMVGTLKGIGRVYLHAVTDTYSSYAFGFLHTSKQPEAAVAVLHNDVLPFYRERDLPITAVLTDNGREFCGKDTHPYEIYLELNDIEHRKTKVRKPQTNGFVERFNGTVLDEFFRTAFRTRFYQTVEELQTDLDEWLVHYNTERPHQGYRNMGRRPMDTINEFLESKIQKSGIPDSAMEKTKIVRNDT
jgi:transposase InsO family protein